MMRISLILFCLIPLFSIGQEDTTSVGFDSTLLEPDFVPLKLDEEWVWYDIANGKASDSIYITDFAEQESGFYTSYVVKDSSHWGILELLGDTVCAFAYDSIIYLDNQLITKLDNQWSYHLWSDFVGDSLIPISFDSLYFDGTDIYLFNQGKTGLIMRNRTIIEPKYDAIHEFSCTSGGMYARFFMSLNGKEYNLLDELGEELLPRGVWDLRCTEDGVFEFRIGNNPEYYIPYWDEFVRPNGRDIIFYRESGAYKLYNDDNSKSELHFSDGRVLKGQYDDYFILAGDFIAVRKNGKVGLTKNGNQLLSAINFDQISPVWGSGFILERSLDYFKFYKGDSCGLMTNNGKVLIEAGYANVLLTEDNNRFIVLDRNLTGVVDRKGKTVIPLQYDIIRFEKGINLFAVQHNARVGFFNYDGTQRTPIEYDGYRNLKNFEVGRYRDGLLALKKNGQYYFANRNGFIDESGFDHFNFSQDVLKTYDSKAISVFLFDEGGKIEDRSNYPVYRNAIVEKDYYNKFGRLSGWDVSELEENQQEGYFGLRWFKKRGFGVLPTFRTVREVTFGDYLGFVPVTDNSYKLTANYSADIISAVHHLNLGAGNDDGRKYFSSELAIIKTGSSDRFINRALDGEQYRAFSYDMLMGTIGVADIIHYSDVTPSNDLYRRYFKGGGVEVCPIESSDVSFYDYFHYLNATDGLRVSYADMKTIMNPKLGVKFINSECEIINSSTFDLKSRYKSYSSVQSFEEYRFLNNSVFFEKPLETDLGSLRTKFLPKSGKEEVTVDDVIEAHNVEGFFMRGNGMNVVAKVKKNRTAKIHVDYPNYFFHQDSIYLSYNAGRIVRRVDSNTVRLITPKGKVVADSCIMIRYLNEERFAIYRKNGWRLYDKDGNQMSHVLFSEVAEFKGDRAEFKLRDGTAMLINSVGEELMALPEPRIFSDEDHYYFASDPNKLTNRFSLQTDEAKDGEKYRTNGFFISKKDGTTSVRRFGGEKLLRLKSISSLKTFGSCLYYKKGKHMYSVDSNLVQTKFKKTDKFRMVSPEIGWLEGKNDLLIDVDWNSIIKMTENQRFELRDGNLVVLEGDSVFRNFGSMKTTNENLETATKKAEVEVFSEDGKYGAKLGEYTILPPNYDWLSNINDREFMTRTNSELHLYDSDLKRLLDRPFDRYIETFNGNFVFFYKDQVFVLLDDGETIKMIR